MSVPTPILIRSLIIRLASFAFGWVLLTEGDLRDAWIGGVVAVLAWAASYRVLPAGTIRALRLGPLLRYAVYFLRQSILGGVDVAVRALHPSRPVRPALAEITLDLPGEGLRILYAWTVSLLPGTASVHLDGPRLIVHFLTDDPDAEQELRRLESILAALHRA